MGLSFAYFDYKENLAQQRALFKDCFPETNGESIQGNEHYFWKFHSALNNFSSWEFASYIESEMVGYYATIPYCYKIGNKITNVGMVCDVMTSLNHRGKGIFTKMGVYSTNELKDKVSFTMGYPIRKEVIPGHLKAGWEIPFSLPLYIKFLRFNTLFKTKNLRLLTPLANTIISIYNFVVKTKSNNQYKIKFSTNICHVEGYESFVKEWIESVPNALIKDLKFAQWRYSAPDRYYNFLSVYNTDGKMIGFVSYRSIIKESVPSYGILDYMVIPGNEDCHNSINKVLVANAKKDNVEAIMLMMSRKCASQHHLIKNGFFKSPYAFQLIIKNLKNEFKNVELFAEKNWHLMWVDSDDL